MHAPVVTRGNSRRWAFALLIAVQIAMVVCLVAVVRSPWFGDFFNRRLRDALVYNHRFSRQKDLSVLDAAARYGGMTSRRKTSDFEIFEEIARASAGSQPERARQALTSLILASKSSKFSQVERDVAMQKYVREELFAATCSLKRGNVDDAAKSSTKAWLGLQRIQGVPVTPKIEMIRSLLKLSSAVALARANKPLADQYATKLARLDDPRFAKAFYDDNNIRGYDYDYNAEYRLQWDMVTGLRSRGAERARCIASALELCTAPVVPHSTRVEVLVRSFSVAKAEKNLDLEKRVLQAWYQTNQKRESLSEQDASLIVWLLPTAHVEQNPDISLLLLTRLCDVMERKLVTDEFVRNELKIELVSECSRLGILFPKDKLSAERIVELSKRFQRLAHEVNRDDSAAYVIQVPALIKLGKIAEAQSSIEEAMSREQSFQLKELPAYANAVHAVARALEEGPQGHELAIMFLRNAVKCQGWDNSSRAVLIMSLCELLRCQPGKVSPEWLRLVSTLDRLAKSRNLASSTSVGVDEFRLRALMTMEKQAEAGQLYALLKRKYANDTTSLARICGTQLNYFRAWPCYSPKYFALALKGAYPEACFLDAPALYAKTYRAHSDETGQMYLWLAEYYLTKAQPQKGLQFCNKVVQEWQANQTIAWYAAKDLRQEITGAPEHWPEGNLSMSTPSKHQLESLMAVYSSTGRAAGYARVQKLLDKVKVLDL